MSASALGAGEGRLQDRMCETTEGTRLDKTAAGLSLIDEESQIGFALAESRDSLAQCRFFA